jgi:hypothetical protein
VQVTGGGPSYCTVCATRWCVATIPPPRFAATFRSLTRFASTPARGSIRITPAQLRRYHLYLLEERRLAVGTVVTQICALRFFCRYVLHRRAVRDDLPYPKERLRLPVVLSPDEVQRLIASAKNLYHRCSSRSTVPACATPRCASSRCATSTASAWCSAARLRAHPPVGVSLGVSTRNADVELRYVMSPRPVSVIVYADVSRHVSAGVCPNPGIQRRAPALAADAPTLARPRSCRAESLPMNASDFPGVLPRRRPPWQRAGFSHRLRVGDHDLAELQPGEFRLV